MSFWVPSQNKLCPCIVSSGGTIYWPYKPLKKAIYGKVMLACTLERKDPIEGHALVAEVTAVRVAIKCISREIIAAGTHAEDPLREIAAMQALYPPGHTNVLRLIECVQDPTTLFACLPFKEKGELDSKSARVRFGFIYANYDPQYFYYECVIMARKLRCV